MRDKVHDNFLRKGYTKAEVYNAAGSSGKSIAQEVKSLIYETRANPKRKAIGPKRLAELRKKMPSTAGRDIDMPILDVEGLAVRPELAELVARNKGTVMRARHAFVNAVLAIPDPNVLEVLEGCRLFVRLNPKNLEQRTEARDLLEWFADLDIRAAFADLHEAITSHADKVLVEVLRKISRYKYR